MSVGTTEKIQELLNNYCTGGYGGGVVGQANIIYLTENYPELVRVERIYRLGDALRFVTPVADSRKFGEFLNDLSGLEDYPVIDESTLDTYISKLEDDDLEQIITDHALNREVFWQVWNDSDRSFGWEQDYVYPLFEVDDLVAEVHRASQNWDVHYGNSEFHYPAVCAWCADVSLPSSELERA